tara:strand:- start:14768 stop:15322 length:555 start_codon:yes stop_codon:yes gene_type:complete
MRLRSVSNRLRWKILTRDDYKCCICGTEESLVVDHVKPFAHGGSCEASNLWTLCFDCNSGKRDDVLSDLIEKSKLYTSRPLPTTEKYNIYKSNNNKRVKKEKKNKHTKLGDDERFKQMEMVIDEIRKQMSEFKISEREFIFDIDFLYENFSREVVLDGIKRSVILGLIKIPLWRNSGTCICELG